MRILVRHRKTRRRAVLPAEAGEDPRRATCSGVYPQNGLQSCNARVPIVPDETRTALQVGEVGMLREEMLDGSV